VESEPPPGPEPNGSVAPAYEAYDNSEAYEKIAENGEYITRLVAPIVNSWPEDASVEQWPDQGKSGGKERRAGRRSSGSVAGASDRTRGSYASRYGSAASEASAVETMMTASESYEGGWPADNEESGKLVVLDFGRGEERVVSSAIEKVHVMGGKYTFLTGRGIYTFPYERRAAILTIALKLIFHEVDYESTANLVKIPGLSLIAEGSGEELSVTLHVDGMPPLASGPVPRGAFIDLRAVLDQSTARLYVDGDLVNLQESGPKSWVIKTLQLGDEELSAAIERVALYDDTRLPADDSDEDITGTEFGGEETLLHCFEIDGDSVRVMIPVHKGDNLRDLAEHHGKIHQWTPDEVSGVAAFMLRTLEDQGLGELVSAGAAESDGRFEDTDAV
jgi:hypothetical protein